MSSLETAISCGPDVAYVDIPSGFAGVFSSTKKTSTQLVCYHYPQENWVPCIKYFSDQMQFGFDYKCSFGTLYCTFARLTFVKATDLLSGQLQTLLLRSLYTETHGI